MLYIRACDHHTSVILSRVTRVCVCVSVFNCVIMYNVSTLLLAGTPNQQKGGVWGGVGGIVILCWGKQNQNNK